MVAPGDSTDSRLYRVLWQLRSGQQWLSETFADRDAAMACFFRWMSRGVIVRWLPGSDGRDEPAHPAGNGVRSGE